MNCNIKFPSQINVVVRTQLKLSGARFHVSCDPKLRYNQKWEKSKEASGKTKNISSNQLPITWYFHKFFFLLQSIQTAVMSLLQVYPQRNLGANEWRSSHLFNIISVPAQMLNPSQTDKVSY